MWIDNLDAKDLRALVPARAIKAGPIRQVEIIGRDLIAKDLIRSPTVMRKAAKSAGAPLAKPAVSRKKVSPQKPKYKTIAEGVRKELHILICTNDPKYAALRKKLDSAGNGMTIGIVGTIAASIGSVIGVAAGVCASFIAALLLAILKIGVNTFCSLAPKKKVKKI